MVFPDNRQFALIVMQAYNILVHRIVLKQIAHEGQALDPPRLRFLVIGGNTWKYFGRCQEQVRAHARLPRCLNSISSITLSAASRAAARVAKGPCCVPPSPYWQLTA